MSEDLTKGNIPKQIRMIAIPAVIGFFFHTMFNITDTFYGGLLSTEALAAMGLSFPVFFIIIALGSGIGTGATALISNAIGAKDQKKVELYTVQSISFAVIISFFLTIIGFFSAPFLFKILGADGVYLSLALSYINVIFFGTIFFILAFTLNSILNARGNTKAFRNFLIGGFILNCILDPILMFGWFGIPKMGLSGIALATVIVEALGVIYLSYEVIRLDIFPKGISSKMFAPRFDVFLDISKQALPASLNMMTIALGIFIITYFISPFGKEAIAAYGIATRVEQLLLLPMIGINIAALAMIGQNNGAKKFARVRETIRTTLKYGVYIAILATVLLLIFGKYFMRLFTSDAVVIDIGTKYLFIAAFISWTYVIMFVVVSILQGLKKPMFAVFIGIYRQIVAPIIIFSVLITVFHLELYGIWLGILIVNWTGALITIAYASHVIKKHIPLHDVEEEDK